MKLNDAIEKILDGQAVLFAGAGFSYGAKNKKGFVKTAEEFKKDLLRDLGMDENSDYPLDVISQYYISNKSSEDLIEKLKENYDIKNVADYHKAIMNNSWKRVYTTNYDQVIEMASKDDINSCEREAVTLSDDFESKSKNSICVHINGYIETVNVDKLYNEFKLIDKSYSCDSLQDNPWFEFMINDFDSASAIIIIGYSMRFDIDIKRLLSAPTIRDKVIFIDSPKIDTIQQSMLESYGDCYAIGIEEFSKKIIEIKKDYVPEIKSLFKSFNCMFHETLTSIHPSYEEIVKFYIEGKKSEKLFEQDTFGEYKYILNRDAMNCFLKNYRNEKVFIALSNLGNGKTIFVNMVENELRKEDVKVYTYVHRYDTLDYEIEEICNQNKKCVVIIDNYPGHMDILNKFSQYGHSKITFLLTARTGVNLMFCKQLERALHIDTEDIHPIYLNQLKPEETKRLAQIIDDNNLKNEAYSEIIDDDTEKFINEDCNACFSNLLLKLFESSNIKKKLEDLYGELDKIENKKIKNVVIFCLLKNISNYDLDFYQILDLFNADFVSLKINEIPFISEIFEQNDDNAINVRSSIISTSLLKSIIKIEDIVLTMKKAFLAADKKTGRTYKELQKSMVSHSQFIFITDTSDEREKLIMIEKFYNDIRNTEFAKHNPFFWEQFASAYIDMKKFDLVKKCIDTALIEAKKNTGFVPFQIKTVQGRYFVEKSYDDLLNGKIKESEAIESITKSTDAILLYYKHPENNLYYVFKVVRFFPFIFDITKNNLNKRELSIYIEKSSIMNKHMEEYLKNDKQHIYFNKVKKWQQDLLDSIDIAKELIKKKD